MAIYKTLVKKASVPAEKKTKQKDYLKDGELPIIDQGQGLIGGYTNELGKKIDCSLPVIVFGDHTKNVKYINFEFAPGADGIKVLQPSSDIDPKYLFFGTLYLTYRLRDHGYARHYQYIEKMDLNVPGIEEQKQIVARIEELFSELDAGVETLRKTQGQLEVYRQAVLKKAFKRYKDKASILSLSSIVTSGSRGWAKYHSDNGARFVRITDLTRDSIKLQNNNVQYVRLPEKAEGKRSLLEPNDILVSITADLGSIALVPQDISEAYINQHIAMVRFRNPDQGRFMAWYLKSEYGQKDLLKNKRGGGKLGLGLDDIRNTPVPVVTESEVNETLEYLDKNLSVCESIANTISLSMGQSEAMRQSILKKAFEGGLL